MVVQAQARNGEAAGCHDTHDTTNQAFSPAFDRCAARATAATPSWLFITVHAAAVDSARLARSLVFCVVTCVLMLQRMNTETSGRADRLPVDGVRQHHG